MTKIDKFEGEFRYLSNFWPCTITYEGFTYSSCEHAYQAAKTLIPEERVPFWSSRLSAAQAKKLGQTLKIRRDWEEVKVSVMELLVRLKFEDPSLMYRLQKTAPAKLIEGNYWHDQVWGDCYCEKHINIPGKNHLGIILMSIRDGILPTI